MPVVSLKFDGPNNGKTIYKPSPTPQVASVWPKSSSFSSNPIFSATSIIPNKPIVLFTINLPVDCAALPP